MKKAVFLDIDGTLTEPGSNVPPVSALEAIRKARENGHYVFLCTGRNLEMIKPVLQYGFDGAIASCGNYILVHDQVILDHPMDKEKSEKLKRVLVDHGIYRTIECIDGTYTDEGFKEHLRAHSGEGGNSEFLRWREQLEKNLNFKPMKDYTGQAMYKIVIISPDVDRIQRAAKEMGDEFQFIVQDTVCGFTNGEVLEKKYTKGTAVEMVCENLGIPIEDSIAFGDSMNDQEMLEAAGIAICMENGSPAMKELADDICPAVGADGLAVGFKKYGLTD